MYNSYQPQQQLNQHSMDYFTSLDQKIRNIQKQFNSLDTMSQQRQYKYNKSIKHYEKYLKKQNEMIIRNSKHCQLRNKMYSQEIRKAWKIGISNRNLILRSIARTNVVKRDADQWIAKLDDEILMDTNKQDNRNPTINQNLRDSQLVHKYNQILNQYNMK